jgi:hypothetical protein
MTDRFESGSRIGSEAEAASCRHDSGDGGSVVLRILDIFSDGIVVRKSLERYMMAAFFLAVSGCGIFDTRQPQSPQQVQSNFIPPTSPDIVITNLKNAIAEKNLDDYLLCLSDTSLGTYGDRRFSFVPPTEVFRQYQSIFANWDRSSESAYFNNLVNQSSSSSTPALTLTSENYLSLSSDSVQYSADYVLLWQTTVPGYSQNFQGYMQFLLGIDKNQNWAIYKWTDLPVGDSSTTWSELKARFSQ